MNGGSRSQARTFALLGKEPIEEGLAEATVVFASSHANGLLSETQPGGTPAGVGGALRAGSGPAQVRSASCERVGAVLIAGRA